MLIDACKLLIAEYHVDGFRFDATHTTYMDHAFVLRLANELKDFKADTILIAENLPNQTDLNRHGFDGFAQWSDPFHDKIKALLREGVFQTPTSTTPIVSARFSSSAATCSPPTPTTLSTIARAMTSTAFRSR
jgi:pullulanase/glycogen debranching enzyme